MSDLSALDQAHAQMQAAPDDDARRLQFYAVLADSALFLMLEGEPEGESVTPAVFNVAGVDYILVFDSEARLAAFAGGAVPYAGLAGRGLVEMIAGQGIGLGVNLDSAPSSMMIGPEGVDWLADTLAAQPESDFGRPRKIAAPAQMPPGLMQALTARLTHAGVLARAAWLAAIEYDTGARGHMLAFVDADPAAQPQLASAVREALVFSGVEAAALDVAFVDSSKDSSFVARLNVGQAIPLGVPQQPLTPKSKTAGPGMDPDRPPILR
ncbi:SseB family protein [Ketogulonicigenium vulgare]|uniref:SseB family protein n=1 Tax=Ketogulonicigenium vulgare TaxID=92945 RepID=UPI002359A9ED|nr:SseB family protein [Ketogulonicigenium vulgare]